MGINRAIISLILSGNRLAQCTDARIIVYKFPLYELPAAHYNTVRRHAPQQ
jgi:hypothetical protein